MTIIEAMHDPNLFRPFFKELASWHMWVVVLKGIFGLSMTNAERRLFQTLTHRDHPPPQQVEECWLIIGRRGGKSFIVSLIAVYLACFRDYREYLGPGERGVIMIIATDRKQARVIMQYVTALLHGIPMLAEFIEHHDSESLDLTNGISIEITTASYRTIRGYTVLAALCDEIAFWRSEDSANPAEEILAALRPAMATIPHPLLIGLGTPYRRSGPLYDAYTQYYGKDQDATLVIQANTRTMNPLIPQRVIDQAYARDPVGAAAEYGAEFRTDVAGFLDAEWIDRAMLIEQSELAPDDGQSYVGFVDPSGGRKDAFTLAIAHHEHDLVILDVCRGRTPPFNPSSVVEEYAAILKRYGCETVVGDRYSGQWVVEAFAKHAIHYNVSEQTKSELYLEAEPLFATGSARILDQRTLRLELLQLERRTSRSGKDSVDHPPQGHDDWANAAAGALVLATAEGRRVPFDMWGGGLSDEDWDTQQRDAAHAEIMTAIKSQGFWWPGDER